MQTIEEKRQFTDEQWEELLERIQEALLEFEFESMRGNHATNWNYLRVWPDGNIVVGEEASPCYPESEYFSRTPHPLTFQEERGNCFSPEADFGWAWEEDPEGHLIAPFDPKYGFEVSSNYDVVENLSEDELKAKLAAGWKRFELDLTNWLPDPPEIDQDIIAEVAAWAEDNFVPV